MGVQSRKNRRVGRRAFPMGAALTEYAVTVPVERLPPPPPKKLGLVAGRRMVPRWAGRPGRSVSGVPDWYKQMQGTTLGDDTLDAMTDEAFKRQVVGNQRELITAHKTWADGDRFQKWIAIAATLAIPLSAAIWRAIGIGRRRKP